MIDIICSSKLYKSSSRKQQILSAMKNPMNFELVTQLADYLDDSYQKPEYVAPDQIKPSKESDTGLSDSPENDHEEGNESIRPSESSGGHAGGSGHPAGLPEGDSLVNVPESEDDLAALEKSMSDEGPGPEPGSADELEEATQVAASPITASSEIVDEPSLDILKGTLNNIHETAGVTRVQVKDNEVWVYYNDDINLNNIMTDVIEKVLEAGYSLEFNRLARSDNAIVFESLLTTHDATMEEEN